MLFNLDKCFVLSVANHLQINCVYACINVVNKIVSQTKCIPNETETLT